MKKSLIALTVAGLAANSALAVDLDSKTKLSAVNFASELTVTGTGIEVTTTETVTSKIGFTITDSAPRFFRYDLAGGATFVGAPTLAIAPSVGSVGGTVQVLADGGAGKDFVLFEVTAATAGDTINNDSVATLTLATGSDNLGLAGSATVTYQMFEFGGAGGTGLLASAGPGVLAAFAPATAIGKSAVTKTSASDAGTAVETTKKIDVANDSEVFASALGGAASAVKNSLGSVYLTDSGYVVAAAATPGVELFDSAGVAATYGTGAGAVVKGSMVEVTGDFSAVKSAYIAATCDGVAAVTGTIDTAKTKATFDTGATNWGSEGFDPAAISTFVASVVNVCIEVTGTDLIAIGGYEATYTPTVNTQFTLAPVTFALNTLGNTGSSQTLNLQLTPTGEGGVYKNYFRVTNTGTNTGKVFFYLINDDGELSATVDMEDVYADGVNTIVGGGSSRQFDIDAVYAAVQAADPTFSVGAAPTKKLRTVVTGEFGGIDVQTYTVSTDSTTFSTF